MSDRKRADLVSSSSSSGSPKKKGGGERLIDSSRASELIKNTFVNGTHDISMELVRKVSKKASEFYMAFTTPSTNEYYHGQGGFLRGALLDTSTSIRLLSLAMMANQIQSAPEQSPFSKT
eukprot:scaffold66596_cov72-Attheya_sp.AAC.1